MIRPNRSLPAALRPEPLRVLRLATLGAAALVAAAILVAPARSATYKWVDENGKVHYTDKLPTEGVGKGGSVLDKQARPVRKIESPPSAAEIRAREVDDEQRRLMAKANEETLRRDKALISSYTTEAEIDLARSRSLGTIDAQIESASAYVQQLARRKEDLDKRRAGLAAKALPPALEREIEGTDSELEKTTLLIEQKRKERQGIVAKYDADRARWRELKAISDANTAAAAAAAAANKTMHPGAVPARK